MAIRIRSAAPDERKALGELKLRASLAWGEHLDALNAMADARNVPAEHMPFVFIAEEAGRILGFATVLPRPRGAAELEDLFIEPKDWRRGVGRALVEEAARRALSLGAPALHLIANPRAEAFYAACGFTASGETPTELGHAIEMELRLTARGPAAHASHPG